MHQKVLPTVLNETIFDLITISDYAKAELLDKISLERLIKDDISKQEEDTFINQWGKQLIHNPCDGIAVKGDRK